MSTINFTGMTGAQAFRAIDKDGGVTDSDISANMDAWAGASFVNFFNNFDITQLVAVVNKLGNVSASYAYTLAGHLKNCTEFDASLINEAAEELVRKDQEVKCMAEKIKALERDHRLEFEQMRSVWEKRISDQAILKLQAEEKLGELPREIGLPKDGQTHIQAIKELRAELKKCSSERFDLQQEVEKLKTELEAVGAGGVQPLREVDAKDCPNCGSPNGKCLGKFSCISRQLCLPAR